MAAVWCDDFKSYGTTPAFMLDGLYAAASCLLVEDPDPIITGTVLKLGTVAFFDNVRKVLPSAQATVGMCARVWFEGLPGGAENPCFFRFNDGANVTHVSIALTSTGVIQAWRGTQSFPTGTLLGASSGPVVAANSFNHIEAKVKISDTVGTVEVRVNGVTVLNLTNQDTGNSADLTVAQVMLTPSGRGDLATQVIPIYFKDFFIWDSTGARNNNFAGTVNVVNLTPNSDVALTWTLSSGATGFSLVNESPPVDTSFISAAFPAPAADKMGQTNLPADVTSVKTLMTLVRARKTDGGDGQLQVGLISGASTALGANRPITTAPTYYSDIQETDPATGVAWLPTAVDASNIQFNRTL